MNNNKLIQLIYGALKGDENNNNARIIAERQIGQIRQNNPNQFFIQCADLLVNPNQNDFIRQSASTLLINSVRAKFDNVYLWDKLQPHTRQRVKNSMLNTLIDSKPLIMKSGANVISHIATIQIPRHEWLDLVDVLAENTTHKDINVRKASIITIGNICEQFNEAAVTIEPRACQQFLAGIIVGTKEKNDISILQCSMFALRNSLSFLKPILVEEAYRNEVLKIIYENLTQKNLDRTAYEALIEFCRSCYDYLGSYLQGIIQMVTGHIQQRNQNTILALQLLDTIGTQYLERAQDAQIRANVSKNNLNDYLIPLQGEILPEVMRCLLIENKNDVDFPEMRNSAAKTLGTFATMGNHQTIDIIATGAATCLNSSEIGHQQATAVLLSTLCQNPDRDYVMKIINNAFTLVLGLLNSKVDIMIVNTLNGLVTIAQFCPNLFYEHSNISDIINKFFQLIESNNNSITNTVLMILKNITQNIQSNCVLLTETNLLLTRIVSYYEKCLDNFQGYNKQYVEKSVLIIMNCITKLKNREVILYMIDFLVNKYYFYYEKSQDREVRLTFLSSIIHTCILALENMIPQEGLINNLCALIDKHLALFGIQEEGLNMISSMAITFNKAFEPRTEKYWGYLEAGLEQISQPRTFKTALCCVGDFSRVYVESFISKQLSILQRLLVLIHQDFDRETKINILTCIADLVLGLGDAAEPFVPNIIEMINISFKAVYELSNNPNEKEYVEELKKALIDMYACLLFSMNGKSERKRSQALYNHFPIVATFVVRTCERSQNPTIDYLKACLFLIFDSTTFYWKIQHYRSTFTNILQSQEIKNLVNILQNFKQKEDVRQLLSLIQQRYQLL